MKAMRTATISVPRIPQSRGIDKRLPRLTGYVMMALRHLYGYRGHSVRETARNVLALANVDATALDIVRAAMRARRKVY